MSAKSSRPRLLSPASYGLPLDLWREVLSYLHVRDLCHASQVCRSWRYLVASLDISCWRPYFLKSTEWRHPNWLRLDKEDLKGKTWQELYREHVLISRLWAYPSQHNAQAKCFASLWGKTERRVIEVGKLCTHKTLRSALDVATQYDRILIHPGLYDEQFEISSKIPFELIGRGPPGSVILVISVEQNAITGRLCNLYIKAPWFTTHVLKISTGHLQVDNCVLEESSVVVHHPATCHFRYCSFRRVHMLLNHTNIGLIENCQFKHCTVAVQGYPKDTRGWAYDHLLSLTSTWSKQSRHAQETATRRQDLLASASAGSSLHTTQSLQTSSAFQMNKSETDSIGVASIDGLSDDEHSRSHCSDSSNRSFNSFSSLSSQATQRSNHDKHGKSNHDNHHHDNQVTESPRECSLPEVICDKNNQYCNNPLENDFHNPADHKSRNCYKNLQNHADTGIAPDANNQVQADNIVNNLARIPEYGEESNADKSHSHFGNQNGASTSHYTVNMGDGAIVGAQAISNDQSDEYVTMRRSRGAAPPLRAISISSRSKLTLRNLPAPEILQQSSDESTASQSQSTASSTNVSLLDNSGRAGQISPPWSSDSESVIEAQLQTSFHLSLDEDPELLQLIQETQGPVFRKCCFHNGQGGLKVSLQAHCRIEHCLFRELQYAIRCLQNAKIAVLENVISNTTGAGIYMRLAAHGLIAGNDIYFTSEAGIDVRRQADPIIQCNRIHHSKRSGIVVLGSGAGLIRGNDIYQNREAALCVLYRSNPYVMGNRICHGLASGITVQEHGRGIFVDNYIAHNRWAGIDIRYSGNPLICKNVICHGRGHGVSISHRGRGLLNNNTIKGNDGCGVFIMGSTPVIQTNQIYNNNSTGVAYVTQTDEGETASSDCSQSVSSELTEDSLSYAGEEGEEGAPWRVGAEDVNEAPSSAKYTCTVGSRSKSHIQLAYNTIFHNNGYGAICSGSEALTLHGNAFHNNKDMGIFVKQSAPVTISNNSVTSNNGAGVHVSLESQVDLTGNGVYENKEDGVIVLGQARLHSNDVFCNCRSALCVQDTAECQAEENRLESIGDPAVRISGARCLATLHNNQLYVDTSAQAIAIEDEKASVKSENNSVLSVAHEQGTHVSDWHLEDPSPRPHIEPPDPLHPPPPRQRVTTVTRVHIPAQSGAIERSKFCTVL